MTNRKNRLFTFFFSLCPGAGEMYFGLYKQGISLMVLFFGLGAIGALMGAPLALFFTPIIWFYSFFHVHNLKNMPEEEFCMVEDKFLFEDYLTVDKNWKFSEKKRRVFAAGLILFGVYFLCRTVFYWLDGIILLPRLMWTVRYMIPKAIVGFLIVFIGIKLLRGPVDEVSVQENEEEEP